ncbi:MAG: CRTAC1 family protein [Janthinobacterium lividum]
MARLFAVLLLCALQSGFAQAPPSPPAPVRSSGGTSTGVPQAPVYDAEHRPITAGGTVRTGPVIFRDLAAGAGLAKWTHRMGTPQKAQILETVGSGVALLDYDNDGWLDIYLVNGSTAPALAGKESTPQAALFHNNHDGTFTNVTEKAGVGNGRWGFGAAVADFDNDGWPDLYVCNFGKNRLYRNNHDGTFTDVGEKAGVALGNWSSSATWGDYDGDGRLDLFVAGYVHYDAASLNAVDSGTPGVFCNFRGVNVMCGPRGLKGEPDHLFHNNGDGTFTDTSVHAGVADALGYYGLATVFLDINNDGKLDLLVANDSTPNYLYLNKGDGTFEDASYVSGYALNEGGRETASMGIASGDYRHTGRLDLYNTTFSDDYNPLYRNDGDANLTDVSFQEGIAAVSVPFLGWGTSFLDYDNDGWLDLLVVNGHVYPVVDRQNWGTSLAQRPLLFHNNRGKLVTVPAVEGTAMAQPEVARGMAVGDLFNDGQMDVVVNNMDSPPSLFRNVVRQGQGAAPAHWLGLILQGTGKSPRDGNGATVLLTAQGMQQRADRIAGGSFASSSDPRIHFGMGAATTPEKVEIRWPDGTRQMLKMPVAADTYYRVVEGSEPQAASTGTALQ